MWGPSAQKVGGQQWPAKVPLVSDSYLTATLPQQAYDGPFLVWARNVAGWSRPIRLNVPAPWWCSPRQAGPDEMVRVFGRNLAHRPDRPLAHVYVTQADRAGRWLMARPSKYALTLRVPPDLRPATTNYGCMPVREETSVGEPRCRSPSRPPPPHRP